MTTIPRTLALLAGATLAAGAARAADMPAPVPTLATCKAALSAPAYGPTIKQNDAPACFAVPGVGDIYVGGVVSGYGYVTSNPLPFSTTVLPSDAGSRGDFSNLQVFVQKPEGTFQAYVQAGLYAIPSLGVANFSSVDQTTLLFTPLPVAYGKFAIDDDWSIQGGRMPTLIGSELPFTFQNLNIERGLLFGQENVINQGVQVNYAHGPLSVSVAGTDGFFSGDLSWLSGVVTYKVDDASTVGINGGVNLGRTPVLNRSVADQYVTPLNQQNSGILDLTYTYAKGPWTVTPYVQFTNVERDVGLGIAEAASTVGGAVLAAYGFDDHWSLAGRLEYEAQTGRVGSGTTSLLYGPGSSAFSATITPTYTFSRLFARAEYSHVELFDAAPGLAFGRAGTASSQDRFVAEGGVTF